MNNQSKKCLSEQHCGVGGLWPLVAMLILALPLTFFAHRGLTRFVLSGSTRDGDITEVVEEHFGKTAGKFITLLYFFAIYPILLMYSVAITNTVESLMVLFMNNQSKKCLSEQHCGVGGLWPLVAMLILALPLTFFAHRGLTRFVLSGSTRDGDITEVVEEHFGKTAGKFITLLYFFAIYPILLMYSVAITNTVESLMVHQLGMTAPPRAILSLVLILGLMAIVRLGGQVIVKAMSVLVFPFVVTLMGLAVYLIPHWNGAIITEAPALGEAFNGDFIKTLWLAIPVMVFSFNHSPIISSFAVDNKGRYGANAEKKCSNILLGAHVMMVMTVMFFVFSCVLSFLGYGGFSLWRRRRRRSASDEGVCTIRLSTVLVMATEYISRMG
ncbi:hypothetical protein [Aeromonas caviae]|uniref:hypothetical protein n=1 Tax=Aeromonas caviae TaxID=648 RepID=UPI0026730DE4|nr:hypothetical protein [Aeromonas caviae]